VEDIGVFLKTYCKYKWFYLLKTNEFSFFIAKESASLRLCAFANPISRKGAETQRIRDDDKNPKYLPLAPIVVKILLCRGSAQKIVTDSGTNAPKTPNLSAPKSIN
jgi:hypothetical protein